MDDQTKKLVSGFQALSEEDQLLLVAKWSSDHQEEAVTLAVEMAQRAGLKYSSQEILSMVENIIREDDVDLELTPEIMTALSGAGKGGGGSAGGTKTERAYGSFRSTVGPGGSKPTYGTIMGTRG